MWQFFSIYSWPAVKKSQKFGHIKLLLYYNDPKGKGALSVISSLIMIKLNVPHDDFSSIAMELTDLKSHRMLFPTRRKFIKYFMMICILLHFFFFLAIIIFLALVSMVWEDWNFIKGA